MEQGTCYISKVVLPLKELVRFKDIRPTVRKLIITDYPSITLDDRISEEYHNQYRKKYLELLIKKETKDLNKLEKSVIKAIQSDELLSKKLQGEDLESLSTGQRLADTIASFGGSWTFIIIFFLFIACWIALNSFVYISRPMDPYPFILLNLMLSCLAAIQAPIIMMSQNRQEQKDRARSEHDYMVNLKAELEIRLLNEKVDHLIVHQIQRLIEIQQLQLDYLEEIANKKKNS
jgi:uncharacterized membrane protein